MRKLAKELEKGNADKSQIVLVAVPELEAQKHVLANNNNMINTTAIDMNAALKVGRSFGSLIRDTHLDPDRVSCALDVLEEDCKQAIIWNKTD